VSESGVNKPPFETNFFGQQDGAIRQSNVMLWADTSEGLP
jgi:hypothetical protein